MSVRRRFLKCAFGMVRSREQREGEKGLEGGSHKCAAFSPLRATAIQRGVRVET